MKEMIYTKNETCEILYEGFYKDYKFYIYNYGPTPCAYIEVPKGHKLYEVHYMNIEDVYPHGGFTFSKHSLRDYHTDNWILGWDYAHADDYFPYLSDDGKKWTTKEIYEEVKRVIEEVNK